MITLGTTAPSTAQASGVGRMFALDVVLAGAPAGSYFQTIRAKLQNTIGSSIPCRAFVYSGTTLVDWVAFTLPTGAGAQTVTANLTGAVTVSNGTFKIGVQMNPSTGSDANFFITTATADTTSFTSTTTYGAAPPNPWTPGSTFAWTSAFAADVFTPSGPPVADFTGTPTSGAASLSVAFTDSSTNTPTSWAWDFGDGATSSSQNPTHSYTTGGIFTVVLVATNAGGSATKTRTAYVTVTEPVAYAAGGGILIW